MRGPSCLWMFGERLLRHVLRGGRGEWAHGHVPDEVILVANGLC